MFYCTKAPENAHQATNPDDKSLEDAIKTGMAGAAHTVKLSICIEI